MGQKLPPTTPSAADDNNTISTTMVARELATQLEALDGYTINKRKYMIWIVKDDGSEFELEIDDGRSNTLAKAFTDTVPDIGWLPLIAPDGYIVKVESDPSTNLDDRI